MSTPSTISAAHGDPNVLVDHDDPEPGMTWFMTLASAIVLTALVLGLSALYYGVAASWNEDLVVSAPAERIESLRSEQRTLLTMPRRFEVLDVEGNPVPRIGVPLADAMEAMVREGSLTPSIRAGAPRAGGQGGSP